MSVIQSDPETAIRLITIDNPPVNPLDRHTWNALSAAIDQALSDQAIHVIIITGGGDKAFIAGANVNELLDYNEAAARDMVTEIKSVMDKLRKAPKPIIAAINGIAAGGGLELAMGCDFRIADKNAKLGLPEVGLGVLPGAGGTQLLPRLIGIGMSLKMMLTGELVDADKALSLGLVDEVVEQGQVVTTAVKIGKKIAGNAPLAIAEIKSNVYATMSHPLETGLKLETESFARLCVTEDKTEGINAFREKRKPDFKGK